MAIRRAYGLRPADGRAPLPTATVASVAAVTALGAAAADWRAGAAIGLVAAVPAGRTRARGALPVVLLVVVGAGAGWRAAGAWDALAPGALGPYEGWVRLVDDPQPYPASTRVLMAVDGQRFEVWVRGRAARLRVDRWRGGDLVRLSGDLIELDAERRERVAWQHVVGELRIDWVADTRAGGPIDRASNRVRAAIERGGAALPGDDGALFRGLVVGDDRHQPRSMIGRFRASGLSHLTAVSGQNVSFVLAAAGPLLRAVRPWWRWAVTLALIGWFVSLTRFEPSIVRAGAMAMLSATAFVLGRERSPARLLALAVTGLVLVDPLIVGSVGFWLSVGATAGVTTVGPWLGERLRPLGFLAMPVGVTLGAQAGVVAPAVLVFGRLPLVSIPANLLAVPVAGFVMLYGLPAGLVAGSVPPLAPIAMFPCRIGVRWVDTVAVIGERLEPGGAVTWVGWAVLVAAVAAIAAMNRTRHGHPSADR